MARNDGNPLETTLSFIVNISENIFSQNVNFFNIKDSLGRVVGKEIMAMKKTNKDTCEVKFVHKAQVESARKAIHDDDTIAGLTETFKVLGDPTRLRIVLALSKEQLCVCDIAALLSMTESAISHQLRLMKNLRLVKFTRKGKMMYYSLDDEHIEDLLRFAVRHVSED